MNRNIRVLQLIGSTGLYGAERWILALMRALDPDQIQSTLINLIDEQGKASDVVESAMQRKLTAVDFYTRGRFNPQASVRLARWVRKQAIDIIHCHGFKSDMVGLLAARIAGCKVITTPHGWSLEKDKKLALYERLDRGIFRFMDRVCPLSPELARAIEACGNRKVRLILNSLDIDEVAAVEPAPRPCFEGFQIGYIGQLIERKNLKTLFRAAKLLEEKGMKIRVTLIGAGPAQHSLREEVSKLALESTVDFMGFRADAVRFLKTFDAFVLPSLSEGIPRCVMEAMAAGVPVVASDIPGNSDLVTNGENGLLFEPGNYSDLSDKVLYLIKNPAEANVMTQKAKEKIEREFSGRRMAEQYTLLYRELVAE